MVDLESWLVDELGALSVDEPKVWVSEDELGVLSVNESKLLCFLDELSSRWIEGTVSQ